MIGIVLIILGIDPGSRNFGYAVCNEKSILEKGHLILKDNDIGDRMIFIKNHLSKLVEKHKVTTMAYEKPFMRNGKYVMDIYYCSSVVPLVASTYKLPLFEYSPVSIKKDVTGISKAEKIHVQKAVGRYFSFSEEFKDSHSADACAVCITHLKKCQLKK